jgi:PKD domain
MRDAGPNVRDHRGWHKVYCTQPPRMFGSTVFTAPLGRNLAALGAAVSVLCLVGAASATLISPVALGSTPVAPAPEGSTAVTAQSVPTPVSRVSSSPSSPAATPVLDVAGDSPAAVSLQWTDTTTGTFVNYTVQEASQASNWAYSDLTAITNAATTAYAAAGLSPGAAYDWKVVENYETCFLGCTHESATTNVVNQTQPDVAFLNYTGLTSTSVELEWTDNASYGGLIAFQSYEVYQTSNGGEPVLEATITTESTEEWSTDDLVSGDGYSFYVITSDCTGGCTGGSPALSPTESNVVTVGALVDLSVSVFALHSTIDLGQSDYFACTASGGKSPYSYLWQFGNSGTLTPGNASESATLNGTGTQTVTCQVKDAEPKTLNETATVQVDPPLVVAASISRSTSDAGQAVTFSCYALNGTPTYTLVWSFGDGDTSPIGNLTHTYLQPADVAPTCEVSDSAGSSVDPAFALVVSPELATTVTVSSADAAPFTALTFDAVPVNGSGTYSSYAWSFGSGVTGSGAQVSHEFTTTGEKVVGLSVTDSNGATATGSVDVDVTNVTVVVSATPSSVATGSVITFSATASGGAGGPYNYSWSFGDGTYGFGATVHHAYSSTGTMDPTLLVTDRLGASNRTGLDPIDVAVPPAALAGIADLLILGLALVAAIIVGVVVLTRRRAAESAELEASATWVPPTDPKRTIKGRKVCPSCGATNVPLRTTCSHCGKPLPRTPS